MTRDLESPFAEESLWQAGGASAAELVRLDSETPFQHAFEGYERTPENFEVEEEWDSEQFYDERAPDEFALDDEAHDEAGDLELDAEFTEGEDGAETPGAIAEFAARLGSERARHSRRPASEEENALLQDYRDTQAGARARWGRRYGQGRFTAESIGRAWMISREEETRFKYASAPVRRLEGFAPPSERVALIEHPLVGSSSKAPVAPIVGRFAEELKRRYAGMRAENYRGHGGGSFNGRGYSLDLYIPPKDDRGFYRPDEALKFLRAVDEAAAAVNAEWRVIYNDFSVADAMNQATGRRNVIFVGTVRRDGNRRVNGLNWHGPDPLILHFHLDLAPRAGGGGGRPAPTPPLPTPRPPAPARPAAELVRFAQRVLNAAEGERLAVDGDLGPRTRSALERFRTRHNLGAGGVLDPKTELALVQRALEELAQQSLFQPGTRDAKTEQALRNFKAERGLAPDATLDAATRAALADAIERRTGPRPRPTLAAQATTDWARVPAEQRMARVMNLLVQRYGYPVNSAAGIVGNLWEESGLLPNRIEGSSAATPMRARNFANVVTDFTAEQVMNRNAAARQGPRLPGIGLAQWTSAGRRTGLFRHSFEGRVLGAAILDNLDAQVDYLVAELRSQYRQVEALVRNPGTSLEAASDEMVYSFEVPASVLAPARQGPRRRLPRDNASVQAVFQRRRASSRRALQAYRGAQQEAYAPEEEAEEEQAFDFETPAEEMFDVEEEQETAGAGPTLRPGARGENVRELQLRLQAVTKPDLVTIDGIFGPDTRDTVIRFQEAHRLPADGVVGRRTWETLRPLSAGRPLHQSEMQRIGDVLTQARRRASTRDYAGALQLMRTLYADPALAHKPEIRGVVAFNMGTDHHSLREFDAAIQCYLEAICAPGGTEEAVPLGLERIREARLRLPPTPTSEFRRRWAERITATSAPQRAGESEAGRYLELFADAEAAPAEEAEPYEGLEATAEGEDFEAEPPEEAELEAEEEEEDQEFEAGGDEEEELLELGELDPALLDIAEKTISREAPEFEEQVSRRWTTCFSAADVGRVQAVYQSNASAAQADSADRCSCIVMLNVALGQLLSLPLKSHPARGGSSRSVDMAKLTTQSIEKAMNTLVKGGYATGPTVMNFYDRRNKTAGTLKPVKLKKSVQAKVLSLAKTKGCWHAFGLSIMDGYHSVLLLVDRTATPAKIFWLDQFSGDVTDDVTSSLDQRITDKTQNWWQAVMDTKGKGYNTTIRIWSLRKRRKKA